MFKRGKRSVYSFITLIILSAVQNSDGNVRSNQQLCIVVIAGSISLRRHLSMEPAKLIGSFLICMTDEVIRKMKTVTLLIPRILQFPAKTLSLLLIRKI